MPPSTDTQSPTTLATRFSRLSPHNRRLVAELVLKLLAAQGTTPRPDTPTDLSTLVDPWTAALAARGLSRYTIRNYRLYTKALLTHTPHPTTLDIHTYLATLVDTGACQNTIRLVTNAHRSFFAYLERNDLYLPNPTATIMPPPKPRRQRHAPAPDHVNRLFHVPMTPKDRAILYLLTDCGLRATELRTIHQTQLHLPHHHLTVIGKGNKERTIPLSPATAAALRHYLAVYNPRQPYLFPGRWPISPIKPTTLAEHLNALCLAADIPRITPHQLRHFFATTMLNDGANIKAVSQLLGHADTSITTDIYWHLDNQHERTRQHRIHSPLNQLRLL